MLDGIIATPIVLGAAAAPSTVPRRASTRGASEREV